VEDGRRDPLGEERRDDRPARRNPALTATRLADVDRLELDALLAKELLGRAARGSGWLPEQDRAGLHDVNLASRTAA
jgi:hypothetical protein